MHRLLVEGGQDVLAQFLGPGSPTSCSWWWRRCSSATPGHRACSGRHGVPAAARGRADLAQVRQIDDVVLLRYALSTRFELDEREGHPMTQAAVPVPPSTHRRAATPPATIRTEVMVPLQFSDGFATPARVLTFDGLVDGREHLALGLGDRATRTSRLAAADRRTGRRWCGCTASASPATCSAASAATAGRRCARRSS